MKTSHHKALKHLKKADKKLARIIEKVGPCTLAPADRGNLFQSLARSIVYQQLSGKAAASIFAKVHKIYPRRRRLVPEEILATPDQVLRNAGLSWNKIRALKDLAQKSVDGVVPTLKQIARMENEEIIERLCQVRGIGPWTVEMLLIFHLGRWDVLPATDYGIRKGFAFVYKMKDLPAPKALHAYGERWKPFRTIAAWYLWRSLELE